MITRERFACPCCKKNEIHDDLIQLCVQIEQAVGFPLKVNSGYRCKTHNFAVGGEPNSQHQLGKAADITCGDISKLRTTCDRMWHTNVIGGLGTYATFCHVDIGSHRRWKR